MSKFEKSTVKCPHCGELVEFRLWRSINTADSPELKEQVRAGSLFHVKCEKCGKKFTIPYPCLYNQMEDGVLVYLVPEESVGQVEEMFASQGFDNSSIRPAYRIVTSYNRLREKLMIFDDQRDDRAVELAKSLYMEQLMQHNIDDFLYSGRNQGVEPVLIAFKNGKPFAHCPLSDQLYAEMAEMVAHMEEDLSKDYVIDYNWAKAHFKGDKHFRSHEEMETVESQYPCGGKCRAHHHETHKMHEKS